MDDQEKNDFKDIMAVYVEEGNLSQESSLPDVSVKESAHYR